MLSQAARSRAERSLRRSSRRRPCRSARSPPAPAPPRTRSATHGSAARTTARGLSARCPDERRNGDESNLRAGAAPPASAAGWAPNPGRRGRGGDVVHELLATEAALDKLGGRAISAEEAGQLARNRHVIVSIPADPTEVGKRRLLIGGRLLTLVIDRSIDPTTRLVVTGSTATAAERTLVEKAR